MHLPLGKLHGTVILSMTEEQHHDSESEEKSRTQQFRDTRYNEISLESWSDLLNEGLESNFFNNFHGKLPHGFQQVGYLKRRDVLKSEKVHMPMKDTGMYKPEQFTGKDPLSETRGALSETEFYEVIDAAIQEMQKTRPTELATETNPINRFSRIMKGPMEQLSAEDQQFFADYIALYQLLRSKGFSYRDLVE
jgi:hypothetical protein